MISKFNKFLVSLNPTSGHRVWWLVWLTGVAMIVAWLVAALPWVDLFTGSMVGIGKYGDGATLTMLAYGVEMSARMADYYFVATIFGILFVKLGIITCMVAGYFARGYTRKHLVENDPMGYCWMNSSGYRFIRKGMY